MRTGVILFSLACTVLIISCEKGPVDQSKVSFVLRAVDSLGVEYGDSTEMFGDIGCVCFLSDSVFVVLDRHCQNLRYFTLEGEHLLTESHLLGMARLSTGLPETLLHAVHLQESLSSGGPPGASSSILRVVLNEV
ncbi:hypothetical protein CSA37_13390 [Candidatus Fermentibacteria bacterium]|nr:MAG: hypothetical protein CSA37_13390 [Candidatus Fermentibacteria bacterium]